MATETNQASAGTKIAASENVTEDAISNGDADGSNKGSILLIEPFYGGSHKQLIDLLHAKVHDCVKFTLPAKKWHWRARTSALCLSQQIPHSSKYKVLFCSSVMNLAELAALRPDLGKLHKVLYFHENQLVYPVRKQQERDFQYGYNQILSCMVADVIVFNSNYNQTSFLDSIAPFTKIIPDHRPRHLAELIRPKCRVLNFPICFPTKGQYEDLEKDSDHSHSQQELPLTHISTSKSVPTAEEEKKNNVNKCSSKNSSAKIPEKSNGLVQTETKDKDNSNEPSPKSNDHVTRRPTCLGEASNDSNSKLERRSMCFSPGEPLGLQLMSPIDAEIEGLMGRGRTDYTAGGASNNMRRSETEPSSLMGGNLPSALDLSPTNNCKSLIDVPAGVESQVTVEVKVKSKLEAMSSDGEKENEESKDNRPLHVIWPHRWEHDKDPDTFFQVLTQLHEDGCSFKISVLGETFTDVPAIFAESKDKLSSHVLNWGFLPSKVEYYRVLESADVVVSTAKHEFFGVGMLEAAYLGCYPLCPNDLVYPEIFPHECLYNTTNQLTKTLRQFCKRPLLVRNRATWLNVEKYSWSSLEKEYQELLSAPCE